MPPMASPMMGGAEPGTPSPGSYQGVLHLGRGGPNGGRAAVAESWFVRGDNGELMGPATAHELAAMMSKGQVGHHTPVCAAGSPDAGVVPMSSLSHILGGASMPPTPLPFGGWGTPAGAANGGAQGGGTFDEEAVGALLSVRTERMRMEEWGARSTAPPAGHLQGAIPGGTAFSDPPPSLPMGAVGGGGASAGAPGGDLMDAVMLGLAQQKHIDDLSARLKAALSVRGAADSEGSARATATAEQARQALQAAAASEEEAGRLRAALKQERARASEGARGAASAKEEAGRHFAAAEALSREAEAATAGQAAAREEAALLRGEVAAAREEAALLRAGAAAARAAGEADVARREAAVAEAERKLRDVFAALNAKVHALQVDLEAAKQDAAGAHAAAAAAGERAEDSEARAQELEGSLSASRLAAADTTSRAQAAERAATLRAGELEAELALVRAEAAGHVEELAAPSPSAAPAESRAGGRAAGARARRGTEMPAAGGAGAAARAEAAGRLHAEALAAAERRHREALTEAVRRREALDRKLDAAGRREESLRAELAASLRGQEGLRRALSDASRRGDEAVTATRALRKELAAARASPRRGKLAEGGRGAGGRAEAEGLKAALAEAEARAGELRAAMAAAERRHDAAAAEANARHAAALVAASREAVDEAERQFSSLASEEAAAAAEAAAWAMRRRFEASAGDALARVDALEARVEGAVRVLQEKQGALEVALSSTGDDHAAAARALGLAIRDLEVAMAAGAGPASSQSVAASPGGSTATSGAPGRILDGGGAVHNPLFERGPSPSPGAGGGAGQGGAASSALSGAGRGGAPWGGGGGNGGGGGGGGGDGTPTSSQSDAWTPAAQRRSSHAAAAAAAGGGGGEGESLRSRVSRGGGDEGGGGEGDSPRSRISISSMTTVHTDVGSPGTSAATTGLLCANTGSDGLAAGLRSPGAGSDRSSESVGESSPAPRPAGAEAGSAGVHTAAAKFLRKLDEKSPEHSGGGESGDFLRKLDEKSPEHSGGGESGDFLRKLDEKSPRPSGGGRGGGGGEVGAAAEAPAAGVGGDAGKYATASWGGFLCAAAGGARPSPSSGAEAGGSGPRHASGGSEPPATSPQRTAGDEDVLFVRLLPNGSQELVASTSPLRPGGTRAASQEHHAHLTYPSRHARTASATSGEESVLRGAPSPLGSAAPSERDFGGGEGQVSVLAQLAKDRIAQIASARSPPPSASSAPPTPAPEGARMRRGGGSAGEMSEVSEGSGPGSTGGSKRRVRYNDAAAGAVLPARSGGGVVGGVGGGSGAPWGGWEGSAGIGTSTAGSSSSPSSPPSPPACGETVGGSGGLRHTSWEAKKFEGLLAQAAEAKLAAGEAAGRRQSAASALEAIAAGGLFDTPTPRSSSSAAAAYRRSSGAGAGGGGLLGTPTPRSSSSAAAAHRRSAALGIPPPPLPAAINPEEDFEYEVVGSPSGISSTAATAAPGAKAAAGAAAAAAGAADAAADAAPDDVSDFEVAGAGAAAPPPPMYGHVSLGDITPPGPWGEQAQGSEYLGRKHRGGAIKGRPQAAPPASVTPVMPAIRQGDSAPSPAGAPSEAAVVESLLRRLKVALLSEGIALPLERVEGCTYKVGGKKLHLCVRNNALYVRAGGGVTELLPHLRRNHLRELSSG